MFKSLDFCIFLQTMSNNAQQGQHRCSSMECSPTSLARRIEGCILRNAWDEEQRAQKALFLLKTRDRRIAFLEKRVAELEDIAANLHEVTLRHSSRVSTLGREKEAVSDFTRSEKSLKTNEETDERTTDCDASNIESFDKRANRDCDTSTENEVSVPCLNLSKSSASNSEKDIFSTPAIDFTLEQKDHVSR
ncbi:uncharacterized protein LOC143177371 [Calliopsis andreniformis]|uniref:uncharacterized protein LOC143177371 n=1 Tax=Calliopsis andreniformis TaxID=337506 RepID=UPI003FCC82E2